jgi:predicted permease
MRTFLMQMRVLAGRLVGLVRRGADDPALDEELRAHLDLLTDEYQARGLSPDDARLAARRAFGGEQRIKMLYREQRGLPLIEDALHDGRLAFRTLVRDRAFALTAVLVVGLGVGITHMFLTIVYAHTWRGLPAPDPERLLYVSVVDDRGADRPLSSREFEELRTTTTALASLVAFTNGPAAVSDAGRAPDRYEAAYIGPGAFAAVGMAPLAGRDFAAEDHRPGAMPVVVLGEAAWRARYGEDASLLGRAIQVNGTPSVVVGIVRDASGFPSTAAIWLPLVQAPGMTAQPPDARLLRVLARLRDRTELADARREIEAAVARVASQRVSAGPKVRARVVPINERLLGRIEGPWLAFLLAGLVIVIIASANIANLMLARGFHRAREVAIRASLGAGRLRLVRQMMTESLAIGLVGGAVGLLVSLAGVRIFASAIPAGTLPYWLAYTVDTRLMATLVVVAISSAVLFGLVPALVGSRTNVQAVLRDGGRSQSSSRTGRPWMVGFLSVEIALAVVLLVAIAIGGLSLRSQVPADQTVNTTSIVTATVTLPSAQYATPDARARFLDQLLERIGAQPAVIAASVTTHLPLAGAAQRQVHMGGHSREDEEPPLVAMVAVGPDYFETIGLAMIDGREFTGPDGAPNAPPVILVNERFVERFVPEGRAVGRPIGVTAANAEPGAAQVTHTIVGIVPALRQQSRPAEAEPLVYVPLLAAAPTTTTLVVRSSEDPGEMATMLRKEALAVDGSVPLYHIQTMAQALRDADWNPRVSAQLANTLTLLCLLLATVGLYAVIAHRASLQRQEMGIRMALGATPWRIVAMVVAGARLPLGLGLLLGVAGAAAWHRAFPPTRLDLTVTSPLVLGVVLLVLTLVTLAACIFPARRAARLDPATVLRE